jgi:hypothetical protein
VVVGVVVVVVVVVVGVGNPIIWKLNMFQIYTLKFYVYFNNPKASEYCEDQLHCDSCTTWGLVGGYVHIMKGGIEEKLEVVPFSNIY